MKKTILTFGLISGVISSLMMVATVPFADRLGHSYVLGYTTIVLSSIGNELDSVFRLWMENRGWRTLPL